MTFFMLSFLHALSLRFLEQIFFFFLYFILLWYEISPLIQYHYILEGKHCIYKMSEPDKLDDVISEWEKLRYVPKPGEPDLPPQLSQFANKTTDDVIKEINRLPFFMTELDDTDGEGGDNQTLEALKSLAYDGEPHEVAANFKNQGNDCYKLKQYKDAVQYYTQGLEVEQSDESITSALYLNRAACNLELKNYRKCIEDCKQVLFIDEKNVKACFRSGKAFFLVDKYEESKKMLEYGLVVDTENKPMKDLLGQVFDKERRIKEAIERKERETTKNKLRETILTNAINLRHISIIKSNRPAELLEDAKIRLENEMDHESQLILPAMILYPTIDEFDFIAEVSELTTPTEILEIVMDRPQEWFAKPERKNFTVKKLQCFMETESGGLVKVGKKSELNSALMNDKAKAPLFDNGLRLYMVPKEDTDEWISKWNKEAVLAKREL